MCILSVSQGKFEDKVVCEYYERVIVITVFDIYIYIYLCGLGMRNDILCPILVYTVRRAT